MAFEAAHGETGPEIAQGLTNAPQETRSVRRGVLADSTVVPRLPNRLMTHLNSFSSRLIVVTATLLLTACARDEITVYRVAKDPAAPIAEPVAPASGDLSAGAAASPSAMSATAVATASGADLAWTAPAGWEPKAANAMRKGSYAIGGTAGDTAELAITAFPGDVGGEVANVNRWRGQLQLAPLAAEEVSAGLMRMEVNGLSVTVVDFSNEASPPQRMLGAIVPFGSSTWFFKLMGSRAVVAEAQPAFLEFLRTVKPAIPTP